MATADLTIPADLLNAPRSVWRVYIAARDHRARQTATEGNADRGVTITDLMAGSGCSDTAVRQAIYALVNSGHIEQLATAPKAARQYRVVVAD